MIKYIVINIIINYLCTFLVADMNSVTGQFTIDTTDSSICSDISVHGKTRGNPEFTESIILLHFSDLRG